MAKDKKEKHKKKERDSTSNTWVRTLYQCGNIIRVGHLIINRAHPVTYFKLAKDYIGMPLAETYSNKAAQNVVHYTSEVVECALSPPIYVVNKAASFFAGASSRLIKDGLNIQHPEIKTAIDVACTEVAYQTKLRCKL